MATKSYRIKLAGEGQEFEAEGDKAFVLAMLKQFGPNAPATLTKQTERKAGKTGEKSSKAPGPSPAAAKALSIREFVQQLVIAKHTDYTLAFGYFLEKQVGQKAFTSADLNRCYYDAKLEPSNTSQMIILNIKRGFMMEAKGEGSKGKKYVVTRSGEGHVESKLSRPE